MASPGSCELRCARRRRRRRRRPAHMAGIRSGRPVAWLGSTMIGRCDSPLHVRHRRHVEQVARRRCRSPSRRARRARRSGCPATGCTRRSSAGLRPSRSCRASAAPACFVWPTSVSSVKFCMLRAPIWIMSAYSLDQLDLPRVHHLGDDRHAVLVARLAEDLQALFAHALESVGAGARLERAAAEDVRARLPSPTSAIASIRSASSTAHGPAIIARWPPPIFTPATSTTLGSRMGLAAGQLVGRQHRNHLRHAGNRLQRLGAGASPRRRSRR